MASIEKVNGRYKARVYVRIVGRKKPVQKSKSFLTRREAQKWAAITESKLISLNQQNNYLEHTLRQAFRRYADEVSPLKKGERWEIVRLSAFESYKLPLDTPLFKITAQDIADFRDSRLQKISSSSVRREISLLSSVFQMSLLEWGWTDNNPCLQIRKPANSKHRQRVLQWWEIKRMLRQMDYQQGKRPISVGQSVAVCMMLALRTGV